MQSVIVAAMGIQEILLRLQGLEHWQLGMIATLLLLQGAFFALVPEEIVILTLGVLWGQDKIGFFQALTAVQLGLLPANAVMVFLGSRFGRTLLGKRPFRWILAPDLIDSALTVLKKNGQWVVVLTRFTPTVRGPVYFATGLSRFGVRRFMKLDFLASLIHVPLLLTCGRELGRHSETYLEAFQAVGMIFGLLLATSFAAVIVRQRRIKVRL